MWAPTPSEGLTLSRQFDISKIDFDLLRREFAKAKRKNLILKDLDDLIQQRLNELLFANPQRINYYERYQKIIDDNTANEEYISEDIIKTWERTRNSFAEHSPSTEESEYLDDFSFIYQLGYDIYIRKQIIEKLIDKRRKENPPKKKGSKKK